MKKKLTIIFITLILCLTFSAACFASMPVLFEVNDIPIATDVPCFIDDGRTYLPIKQAAMIFGATEIEWLPEEEKVTVKLPDKDVAFIVGSDVIQVNGQEVEMKCPSILVDGRIFVPIALVAELTGSTPTWDNTSQTVGLFKEGYQVPEELKAKYDYTNKDLLWLARIVQVEASGSTFENKLAVANVVLNRVKSDRFPDTIYNVIFQPGQFPPSNKSSFLTLVPGRESYLAAELALKGVNNIGNSLFFNNRPFNSDNVRLFKVIDGEYYYL